MPRVYGTGSLILEEFHTVGNRATGAGKLGSWFAMGRRSACTDGGSYQSFDFHECATIIRPLNAGPETVSWISKITFPLSVILGVTIICCV